MAGEDREDRLLLDASERREDSDLGWTHPRRLLDLLHARSGRSSAGKATAASRGRRPHTIHHEQDNQGTLLLRAAVLAVFGVLCCVGLLVAVSHSGGPPASPEAGPAHPEAPPPPGPLPGLSIVAPRPTPHPSLQPSPRPSRRPLPKPSPRPSPEPALDGRKLFCSGSGHCDASRFREWKTAPVKLASSVGDFTKLPAIPSRVYDPIVEHWNYAPPKFHGRRVTLSIIAKFARELLGSNPFKTGPKVPYIDFGTPSAGKVVAISQRQLSFIVVNVLFNNSIGGDGLSAALQRCGKGFAGLHSYVYSLLSMLAILSVELQRGSHGKLLIAATPRPADDSWRHRLDDRVIKKPQLCTPGNCTMKDFMAGGTKFQALTDIAGANVGGGAQLCSVADSQDESLVQFYSEVLAFSFFQNPDAGEYAMLPVPWILLGARRYVNHITGVSHAAMCGNIPEENWLNEDILSSTAEVLFHGSKESMYAGSFVAVASKCSFCLGGCSKEDAINHMCDNQRAHLDDDITLWYQVYEPTMYDRSVELAFTHLIRRIGTGPWGAGVWYGDSQQYFLTTWLATNLLLHGAALDYYVYSHFCENPGNQCFVLGAESCKACIADSGTQDVKSSRCGKKGLHDMVERFAGKSTRELYDALQSLPGPPDQVFDSW